MVQNYDDFNERLEAFFSQLSQTLELAQELAGRKTHGFDLVTLVCSRIDGLAMAHGGADAESPRVS